VALHIEPTSAPLGAFVTGLDIDRLTQAEAGSLVEAFLDYGVLVFRGHTFDAPQMLKLSQVFGETKLHPIESIRHPDVPMLIVLAGNDGEAVREDDPDADQRIGVIPWHADLMYTDTPNRGALLRAVKIPETEGQTGFIDTARLYRQLPVEVRQRIQGLRIIHSYAQAYAEQNMVRNAAGIFPDVIHPLVYVHPVNNLPVLNISPSSAKEILGLPAEEAKELLDYLIRHASREEEAYIHHWQADDVVLWDNWRTIHRAYGHLKRHPRLMHRTTLKAVLNTGEWVAEPAS
jgi:taurine dioxygenase